MELVSFPEPSVYRTKGLGTRLIWDKTASHAYSKPLQIQTTRGEVLVAIEAVDVNISAIQHIALMY